MPHVHMTSAGAEEESKELALVGPTLIAGDIFLA